MNIADLRAAITQLVDTDRFQAMRDLSTTGRIAVVLHPDTLPDLELPDDTQATIVRSPACPVGQALIMPEQPVITGPSLPAAWTRPSEPCAWCGRSGDTAPVPTWPRGSACTDEADCIAWTAATHELGEHTETAVRREAARSGLGHPADFADSIRKALRTL